MKHIFSIALFGVLLFYGCTAPQKKHVLFIGNSYTYRNEMPDIFKNIAVSKGKDVEVEAVTKGKATFAIQSNRQEVLAAIQKRKWDYIVLQGSSRDMFAPKQTFESETIPSLEKIISEIKEHNPTSKVLFYMTWGYKNGYQLYNTTSTYKKMSQRVAYGYLKLFQKYRMGVVPVGLAWLESRKKRPDVNLYVKDGAHPSWKGSYLAASCFYAAIFKESAVGSNYYGVLGPKICRYLQTVASKKVLNQKKRFGLVESQANDR